MKGLGVQFSQFLRVGEVRQNFAMLMRFIAFMAVITFVLAALFHVILEYDRETAARVRRDGFTVVEGNAAERTVLEDAGLAEATAVIVTTNDDAMNVYLSIWLRRLRPEIRIAARVTHEKNQEALWRAGADFVASQASLGKEALFAALENRQLLFLGEGVDFFHVPVPASLAGSTLGASGVGAKTGLQVVPVRSGGKTAANPTGATELKGGMSSSSSETARSGSRSPRPTRRAARRARDAGPADDPRQRFPATNSPNVATSRFEPMTSPVRAWSFSGCRSRMRPLPSVAAPPAASKRNANGLAS